MCERCNSHIELCNDFRIRFAHLCRVETHPPIKTKKMNTTEGNGNLIKTKGKLKQKFALLTEDDMMLAEGKKEEIQGRLQIRLGKQKKIYKRSFQNFNKRHCCAEFGKNINH